jgi:hypothetical protein
MPMISEAYRLVREDARAVPKRVRGKLARERLVLRRRVYQTLHPRSPTADPRTLLILGCQRSGTSMILDLLTHDRRTETFPEESALSRRRDLRLKPLDLVNRRIDESRSELVVLKPLVESQRAPELLSHLRSAKAVWMYRKYDSVAASDLRYFGLENGVRNLRFLLSNEPPNWRGEFVPNETRETLETFYSPTMSPDDAAALFWWARNSLYFQLGLEERDDVFLCAYEALVTDPRETIAAIYDLVGMSQPMFDVAAQVHGDSLDRGADIRLSPSVRGLCEALYARLNACRRAQASQSV